MFQNKLIDAGIRKTFFSFMFKQEDGLCDHRASFQPELCCDSVIIHLHS